MKTPCPSTILLKICCTKQILTQLKSQQIVISIQNYISDLSKNMTKTNYNVQGSFTLLGPSLLKINSLLILMKLSPSNTIRLKPKRIDESLLEHTEITGVFDAISLNDFKTDIEQLFNCIDAKAINSKIKKLSKEIKDEEFRLYFNFSEKVEKYNVINHGTSTIIYNNTELKIEYNIINIEKKLKKRKNNHGKHLKRLRTNSH